MNHYYLIVIIIHPREPLAISIIIVVGNPALILIPLRRADWCCTADMERRWGRRSGSQCLVWPLSMWFGIKVLWFWHSQVSYFALDWGCNHLCRISYYGSFLHGAYLHSCGRNMCLDVWRCIYLWIHLCNARKKANMNSFEIWK